MYKTKDFAWSGRGMIGSFFLGVFFTMMPWAVFASAGVPTIQITSPTPNQNTTNGSCTVTGKAGDNVAVAAVYYALNGGLWTNATTANNWTNWTASLTLTPGTNTLQAYARDTSGNLSPTNTLKFQYVVLQPMTVQIFGLGTANPKWGFVSPNDNGLLLAINESYTMTAIALPGFAFTNWTGGLTTNTATLRFTMTTNLAVTANFVDVQKPTVSILSPTPLQSSLWLGTSVQNQPSEPIVSVAPGMTNATAPPEPQGVAGPAPNITNEFWIAT